MKVVIATFPKMTALDAIGPYEVFKLMPDTTVHFVGAEKGTVITDSGLGLLNADMSFADAEAKEADLVLIPGSAYPLEQIEYKPLIDWIIEIHPKTKWTTSVCTGSLALGKAGVLKGISATSHWLVTEMLKEFGATVGSTRVIREGKIITAAGVSAGIDMALRLVAFEFGDEMAKKIQLAIEYDPEPPFSSGSVEKAEQVITEGVKKMFGIN